MSPVKLGLVGCGGIAQIQHLPSLMSLQEEFEVVAVCDLSAKLAKHVAGEFHVPLAVTDVRDLLAADVDAVLLCPADPKTDLAVTVLEAGKHLLVEKPLCYSLQEADRIIAATPPGTVAQMAYMKVFDPAFEAAQREVVDMEDVTFVQVNHLHTENRQHLEQFRLKRFDDFPPEAGRRMGEARQAAVDEALGDVSAEAKRAFFILANSMIHDLYGLRLMLGRPEAVVNTEIWPDGSSITFVLAYPGGCRCVASWVDLPDVWAFRETLEVYASDRRVLLTYPTGFARGILSEVTIHGIDGDGTSFAKQPAIEWESPFRRELRHFHDCIVNGAACRSSVAEARHDIALIIDIIKAYTNRA
ncbi:MAG: Gfo/Idh/MocA family oxidoreductase [Candidatus Latescibacteria bacterium]|nr:Gfo/Idh/MocA family oxidoreductase [Candidatus Latescibacterota bacterium]HJP32455.1 Gfo/Idh/MocA family oxidoreductase [Candidatus Latescibacterota bacterium]